MSQNDDELNEMLNPIRLQTPDDLQLRRWQNSVHSEVIKNQNTVTTTKSKWVLQLVAAMLVGIVMGGVLFKSLSQTPTPNSVVARISADDATFEHSHTNLD